MAESDNLAQIVVGCKNGDAESFSQIVDLYASRFYGYFYRLTGSRDVSDDLLSELFVKLVEKISSFKDGTFEGWLFKVASNIFYDYLRGKQREKKILDGKKVSLNQEYKSPNSPAMRELTSCRFSLVSWMPIREN